MGRGAGITEEQLAAIADHGRSPVFDARDLAVLDYAEALTSTPARDSDALIHRLRRHLDDEGLVELTAAIAWENFRSRFNRGFDVQSQDFSDGAACPLPDRPSEASEKLSSRAADRRP